VLLDVYYDNGWQGTAVLNNIIENNAYKVGHGYGYFSRCAYLLSNNSATGNVAPIFAEDRNSMTTNYQFHNSMGMRKDSILVDYTGFWECSSDWILTRTDASTEIQFGSTVFGNTYGQTTGTVDYFIHQHRIVPNNWTGWNQPLGTYSVLAPYFSGEHSNDIKRFILFKRPQSSGCRFGIEMYYKDKRVWTLYRDEASATYDFFASVSGTNSLLSIYNNESNASNVTQVDPTQVKTMKNVRYVQLDSNGRYNIFNIKDGSTPANEITLYGQANLTATQDRTMVLQVIENNVTNTATIPSKSFFNYFSYDIFLKNNEFRCILKDMNRSDAENYDEFKLTLAANINLANLLKENNVWTEYNNMKNVNISISTINDTFNNHTNDLYSYLFKRMAQKSYEDALWRKLDTTNFANV